VTLKLALKHIKDKKHSAVDLEAGRAKEVKPLEEDGVAVGIDKFNIMYRSNPKGLGDSIENFTTKTGIKKMVDVVSEGLNIPCGCEGRRKAMNALFPYRNKN